MKRDLKKTSNLSNNRFCKQKIKYNYTKMDTPKINLIYYHSIIMFLLN